MAFFLLLRVKAAHSSLADELVDADVIAKSTDELLVKGV